MSSRAGANEGEGADEEGEVGVADAEAEEGVEGVVVAVAVKRVGARWG